MPDPSQTLADLAQAFGLLGQPPYVSLLAQQRALAQAGEQVLTLPVLTGQQQALLARQLGQLAPEDALALHRDAAAARREEAPHG